MTKDEFITRRTRIISEMLDNPDKYGIYPTTKCFEALDALFDEINYSVSDEEIVASIPYPNPISKHQSDINIGWIKCRKAMRDNPEQFKDK